MKTLKCTVLAALLCLAYAGAAAAQTTATQDVTIVVEEVSTLSVSGDATVTVNGVNASGTIEGSDNATTYDVTTNASGAQKITGQLTSGDFSAGLALFVDLTAPAGAAAAGEQQLTNASAVDLVTGISSTKANALTISYRATAAETVAPNAGGETQTVTYTITN